MFLTVYQEEFLWRQSESVCQRVGSRGGGTLSVLLRRLAGKERRESDSWEWKALEISFERFFKMLKACVYSCTEGVSTC